MATTAINATDNDTLTRFLIAGAHTRGALIRGSHIMESTKKLHGLNEPIATLFGQQLLASILLLSISKGGVRQVLQLDAIDDTPPIQRIVAEAKAGAVRGYINWKQDSSIAATDDNMLLNHWMGHTIRLSTVRDLGIGQPPYISTIEHEGSYLADHLIHYLHQSVQIRADIVLCGDTAIMIEAMPGCDEEHWFKAVEQLAKIPNALLASGSETEMLSGFEGLKCKVVGHDHYSYQCSCSKEKMTQAIASIPQEQWHELVDGDGNVHIHCQYCNKNYAIAAKTTTD